MELLKDCLYVTVEADPHSFIFTIKFTIKLTNKSVTLDINV